MGTHQKLITEDLHKQAIAQLASTNKENRTTISNYLFYFFIKINNS